MIIFFTHAMSTTYLFLQASVSQSIDFILTLLYSGQSENILNLSSQQEGPSSLLGSLEELH